MKQARPDIIEIRSVRFSKSLHSPEPVKFSILYCRLSFSKSLIDHCSSSYRKSKLEFF